MIVSQRLSQPRIFKRKGGTAEAVKYL